MADSNPTDSRLMSELASQMISHIGSFFERVQAAARRPLDEFSSDTGSNYLYVLYSPSGMPLHADVVLESMGQRELGTMVREALDLAERGYVDTYRTVELGTEKIASEMRRLIVDLFGNALPLTPTGETTPAVIEQSTVPVRRGPGRPKGSGRKAGARSTGAKRGPGRPRGSSKKSGARRGPGRPPKSESATAAPVKRGPGRPKKTESAATAPAAAASSAPPTRGPGRPRKVVATAAPAVKRGPGRPRKTSA